LEGERQVPADIVKGFAERSHLETVETSAVTGKNVKEAFARMALEASTLVANGSISVGPVVNKAAQPLGFAGDARCKVRDVVNQGISPGYRGCDSLVNESPGNSIERCDIWDSLGAWGNHRTGTVLER
jgi:hypothetical protein